MNLCYAFVKTLTDYSITGSVIVDMPTVLSPASVYKRSTYPREEPGPLHQTEAGIVPADDNLVESMCNSEMEDASQEPTQTGLPVTERTTRQSTSSSNNSPDSEIRQSRQVLHALRRQQACLELRLKIKETRRKVSNLQSRTQGDEDERDRRGGELLQASIHDQSSSQSSNTSRQSSRYEVETVDSPFLANLPIRQRVPDQEPFMKASPRLRLASPPQPRTVSLVMTARASISFVRLMERNEQLFKNNNMEATMEISIDVPA